MLDAWLNWLDADGCVWGLWYLWGRMDWFGHAAVSLLALMLANAVVIVAGRLYRYGAARRQSRVFVRDAASALRDGKLDEVIAIAVKNKRSHVASVVADGIATFASAPPEFTDAEAIAAAKHALQRSSKLLAADLKHGLRTLSTIASSALFIGLLGTCFGILDAFGGVAMEKSAYIARTNASLSTALATTAMGLFVAVPTVWFHNYLRSRMEMFESEMSNAALEVVTYLNTHREWRNRPVQFVADATSTAPSILRISAVRSWEAPYDHQWALLSVMCCCALYLAFNLAEATYLSVRERWQPPYVDSVKREFVGGQELVSPDHRYRAVIPQIYREQTNYLDKNARPQWVCQSGSEVALGIIPNDRPLAWKPHLCGERTVYDLEPTAALLTWNCNIPIIAWRTNDELVAQCIDCSTNNLQLVKLDSFPGKITVLGPDGKRIDPQVVHPQPQCFN
jgi:biopolymer transport protein ExbB/TolQ